jgi:hypothetical protein
MYLVGEKLHAILDKPTFQTDATYLFSRLQEGLPLFQFATERLLPLFQLHGFVFEQHLSLLVLELFEFFDGGVAHGAQFF